MNIDRFNLYNAIVSKWGIESQINMAIEECAELIKALNKYRRQQTQGTLKELQEEIGDVLNMAEQLEIIFIKEVIEKIRDEKLKRVSELLKKEKP